MEEQEAKAVEELFAARRGSRCVLRRSIRRGQAERGEEREGGSGGGDESCPRGSGLEQ
jgi:hypothetical protein